MSAPTQISSNIFTRCSPAIGSSLDSCGTVTKCDVISATPSDLTTIFTDNAGKFRDMQSLIGVQFEMKACGARVNPLFDLLMATKRNMRPYLSKKSVKGSDSIIEPFIMAGQKSVINDEYWALTGNAAYTGSDRLLTLASRNNAAVDASYFPPRSRIHVFARTSGGTHVRAVLQVVGASVSGSNLIIQATPQTTTLGASTKSTIASLTAGIVVRGTANINDYEQYCANRPALNPNQNIPFWFETNRWSMCVDELYEEWLMEMTKKNPYFARFGDISIAERNRQYANYFQRELVNQVFWGKPLANQTLSNYRSLEQISTYGSSPLYLSDEGVCVGYRANAIGIYEQLAQCGRVKDLQNSVLNLVELFNEIYNIVRSRSDQGKPGAMEVDIMTDSFTAANIQRAMILYYNDQSAGLARFNIDTGKVMSGKNDALGFKFDTYHLVYPAGVTINIITDYFFDDIAAAAAAESITSTGRFLWILDWSGIYMGTIASNRIVHRTGDIRDLAKTDSAYACVMANPTREVSLNSLTWTLVIECPSDHLIVEGFNDNVPEYRGVSATGSSSDLYGSY